MGVSWYIIDYHQESTIITIHDTQKVQLHSYWWVEFKYNYTNSEFYNIDLSQLWQCYSVHMTININHPHKKMYSNEHQATLQPLGGGGVCPLFLEVWKCMRTDMCMFANVRRYIYMFSIYIRLYMPYSVSVLSIPIINIIVVIGTYVTWYVHTTTNIYNSWNIGKYQIYKSIIKQWKNEIK